MSLIDVSGIGTAGIVSNKNQGWKPGGICPRPMPNPNDLLNDRFERLAQKREEASKEKPASERNLGDWINIASGLIRKLPEKLDSMNKY